MDDIPTFTTFITDVLGVTIPNARLELTQFIPTFRQLMTTSDDDIDEFVKAIHSANSGRPVAQRIFYSPALTANLKALSFTLVDRNRCNALYDAIGIASIDQAELTLMKTYRSQALQDQKNEDSTSLPEIAIPTFTTDNYDDFMSKFLTVVSCTKGVHGVSIDYIVHEVDGNFDDFHATRKLKLQACLSRHGPKFNEDSQTLYGLYLQYIGTTGHGANIVKRFQQHKQGYQLHLAFIT
jgi:hypothetical protein